MAKVRSRPHENQSLAMPCQRPSSITGEVGMTEDDDVWIYSLGESIEKRSIRKLKMMYKDHVIHDMEDYGDDDVGDAKEIVATSNHALILTARGLVFGVGLNSNGEIGTGNTDSLSEPVQINGLPSHPCKNNFFKHLAIKQISCGSNFSAFLTVNGKLYTCGDGRYGRLGLGKNKTGIINTTPSVVNFKPLSTMELVKGTRKEKAKILQHVIEVVFVACGANHTATVCKVESDTNSATGIMQLYTWGNGINGQLGHGNDLDQFEPEPVQAPFFFEDDFVSIAATQHEQAKLAAVSKKSTKISNMKIKQAKREFFNMKFVACGLKHTVVITTKGTAFSFGFGGSGRLGLGDEETKYRPKRILGHQLIMKRNKNYKRSTISHMSKHAMPIERNTVFAHAACGARHTILIAASGMVFSCGRNDRGQLGLGLLAFPASQRNPKKDKLKLSKRRSRSRGKRTIHIDRSPGNRRSRSPSKRSSQKVLLYSVWLSSIEALRHVDAYKAFCGPDHTIILTKQGKTYGFGLNDKGQVTEYHDDDEIRTPVENGFHKHAHTRTISAACSNESTYLIAQHKASQTLDSSEGEEHHGEPSYPTEQTQGTNNDLLKKVMGNVEDFPCHERQFLEQLVEQDRIPLHAADKQYNKKDAQAWASEVGEKKIEEIQNALLMAWEKFDNTPQKTRSKK